MSQIIPLQGADWSGRAFTVPARQSLQDLEAGKVLFYPQLAFTLSAAEQALLDPKFADPKRKNISLEADGQTLRGVTGSPEQVETVRAMMARFQANTRELMAWLCEPYLAQLQPAPTSLRLHRVENRQTSWRKDDSRLHVDAFPSRPLAGHRILRVFVNIHPGSEPRVWRVGEPFMDVAKRFAPHIKAPLLGSAALLHALKITKRRRTYYDHLMLGLHDAMKADMQYQQQCPQETMPFPPGCAWVCFSDQASHAVMSGQFMMEQTYFLPPSAMVFPALSPQCQLEALLSKPLV